MIKLLLLLFKIHQNLAWHKPLSLEGPFPHSPVDKANEQM